jgi:hypothetical protein
VSDFKGGWSLGFVIGFWLAMGLWMLGVFKP